MSSYVRPLIDAPVFRDADGAVISYGNRWHESPPEDTYSVDTHPERFAPLHVVANALIAHLREMYDVAVDEGVEAAGCAACDSSWQAEADELEQQVFATVSGNYRETIERGLRPWVDYAFTYPDGASSGKSRSEDLPAQRLKDAKPILHALPDGWDCWPRSASAS